MLMVDINVSDNIWNTCDLDVDGVIKKVADFSFEAGKFAVSYLQNTNDIFLSVECTNDDHIQSLNQEYRNKNKATNVLSFPQLSEDILIKDDIPVMLGDIVLAFETIQKESIEQDKSFKFHLSHLVAHGMLHLLGFDHENDEDAEEMEGLEILIMKNIGYDNPYK